MMRLMNLQTRGLVSLNHLPESTSASNYSLRLASALPIVNKSGKLAQERLLQSIGLLTSTGLYSFGFIAPSGYLT